MVLILEKERCEYRKVFLNGCGLCKTSFVEAYQSQGLRQCNDRGPKYFQMRTTDPISVLQTSTKCFQDPLRSSGNSMYHKRESGCGDDDDESDLLPRMLA